HERIDGRGYPEGLAGENIPLMGRLICIADCFDAMTTNRTYRSALPLPVALAEVRRCAGTQFDPKFAEVFLDLDHESLLKQAMAISNTQEILHLGRDLPTATGKN
ncbi:MAG TPA: HD domain-containing phosphohydrolase, partial [Phycisphaerae bacterium]|nr:HD domain-containing phosphohydrolase [Phycisphaerae bacterium]